MKKNIAFLLIISIFSCTDDINERIENPILADWDTPYGVPPFDKIKDHHYYPAFLKGIEEQTVEIDSILSKKEAATFRNTIEALEKSGSLLEKVSNVFYAVNSAHSNDSTRWIAKKIAPLLSTHRDDIYLNLNLFKRIETVYFKRDSLSLDDEESHLLKETYKKFVRSGIGIEVSQQARLKEINAKLAVLQQTFGDNLLSETNSFSIHVTEKENLGNLPASLVATAKEEAKKQEREGWVFTLSRPSINPFLQYSPNRDLRKELFIGYAMRSNNDNARDNKKIASEIASLRIEKANLIGFPTHAHYVLSNRMAATPENVYNLLDQIWAPALQKAKQEKAALQSMMNADGVKEKLEGWDWRYYSEKVKKSKYDLDEEELRPYFEYSTVRDGTFKLATKLFGLTFKELENIPVWHESQQVYEISNPDGSHLGILYMDFFTRPSKRGGAWMNDLRPQSKLNGSVTPIVTNNFNFPPPTKDLPSLLSFSEAQTLFHEFGHALHGLFSNVKYASLSGTNTPRDFVEFPSQVMENWMSEPEVLKLYAKHYETGEVIPDVLIEKIQKAATFNQGFATVEYMAASYLDMEWHMLETSKEQDVLKLEKDILEKIGLIDEIIPRYRSTYFSHIFRGGYSAGYYSYIWSEVLDADAFEAFKETSLFDQAIAEKYRKMLSMGGSRDGMKLYREFRGRDPKIDALLRKKGFD